MAINFRRRRISKLAGTPFGQNLEERANARQEHHSLCQQIEDLERFIVSVPAVIERRRSKFRDMLPPPDTAAIPSGGGPGRLSRRQLHDLRWARARLILSFTLLAVLLVAVAALIAFLLATRS